MSEKTINLLNEKNVYVSLTLLGMAITIAYFVITTANKIDSFIYIQQKNDERYENHEKRITSIEEYLRNNVVFNNE